VKQALSYLLEGLWLMRQAPALYLFVITAHAALNYYLAGTSNMLLAGILFTFVFYYWAMNLAAFQMSGAGGGPLEFLKPRNAPLLGVILYVLFSAMWAVLVSIPVWLLGGVMGGAMLAGKVEGADLESADQQQIIQQMAEAMLEGPVFWILTGMLMFTFVFYFRFLSNRVTVPIIAALYDVEIAEADAHAGPRSGKTFPVLFWIFALPTLPMWVLSLFILQIVPADSGAMLIFDLAMSFSVAWPFVAAVCFVNREIGPPQQGAT
jgi:hypothetical protein